MVSDYRGRRRRRGNAILKAVILIYIGMAARALKGERERRRVESVMSCELNALFFLYCRLTSARERNRDCYT